MAAEIQWQAQMLSEAVNLEVDALHNTKSPQTNESSSSSSSSFLLPNALVNSSRGNASNKEKDERTNSDSDVEQRPGSVSLRDMLWQQR